MVRVEEVEGQHGLAKLCRPAQLERPMRQQLSAEGVLADHDVHNTRQPELVGALGLAVRLGPRPKLLRQSRDASKLEQRAEQRPAGYLGEAGRRPAPARQQPEAEDGEERDADLEHAELKEHSGMLKLHEAKDRGSEDW